jgi:uncharacterized phage infection (PIP) family protein YhgE
MSIQVTFESADDLLGLLGQSQKVVGSLHRLETAMATQQDNINKLTADFTAAAERVNTDLGNLNSQVTTLQQQVQALQDAATKGDVSTEMQAAIDALDASINALDVPAPVPTPDPNQPTPTPDPNQPTPVDPNAPPAPAPTA